MLLYFTYNCTFMSDCLKGSPLQCQGCKGVREVMVLPTEPRVHWGRVSASVSAGVSAGRHRARHLHPQLPWCSQTCSQEKHVTVCHCIITNGRCWINDINSLVAPSYGATGDILAFIWKCESVREVFALITLVPASALHLATPWTVSIQPDLGYS